MVSMVDTNDVDQLVTHPPTVLYIPDFPDALVEDAEDNLTYKTTHKDISLKDWITPGLTSKIHSFFPTADQIEKSTGARDLEGFKAK
jgi:hypothetical protein